MSDARAYSSGKDDESENFPVASRLIEPQYRPAIIAFYRFVRVADDIADHETLADDFKVQLLDGLEGDLLGRSDINKEGVALRKILAIHKLTPEHALDLLKAFRIDIVKRRYQTWPELMSYCELSAMPVGRFVLDVHGESRASWPSSDAICAALQIINHLQDCGEDYHRNDRIYVPQNAIDACGAKVEDLNGDSSSPALRKCIAELAQKTRGLLRQGDVLPDLVRNRRLALEISVIKALAMRLLRRLEERDPLSDEMHLLKSEAAATGLFALLRFSVRRLVPRFNRAASVAQP